MNASIILNDLNNLVRDVDKNCSIADLEINKDIEVINSPNINYLLFHFHHNIFSSKNSKCYLQSFDHTIYEKIKGLLMSENSISNEEITNDNISVFFKSYFDVYFDLIGRIDSYTEAIYRQLHHFNKINDSWFFLSFEDNLDTDIQIEKQKITNNANDGCIRLIVKISNKLRTSLLGGNHLISLLAPLIWKYHVKDNKISANSEYKNQKLAIELDKMCFMKSKEAYISNEVAKSNADKVLKKSILELYSIFYEDPLISWQIASTTYNDNINHDEDFAKIERVLGMLQALAMFSVFSTDRFMSFIPDQNKNTNGYYSGIAIGGNHLNSEQIIEGQSSYERLNKKIISFFDKKSNIESNPIKNILNKEKTYNSIQNHILNSSNWEFNRIDRISLQVIWVLADELFDAKHEGKDLSFRLIIGRDDYLREYFIPEHIIKRSNDKNDDFAELWKINLENEDNLENRISLLISLIEANYAFLQENNKYLCFSISEKEIEARFIGVINKRISKFIKGGDANNIFSRSLRLESIGETLKNVFFANIDKENTSIYSKGKLITSFSIKERTWLDGNNDKYLHTNYKNLINLDGGELIQEDEIPNNIINDIFEILRIISNTSGLGTTLILGDYNELKKYTMQTAKIIEVIPNWAFDEITDKKVLFDLAIKDGALIFDTAGKKIYPRHFTTVFANEKPINPIHWDPEMENNEDNESKCSKPLWNRWKDNTDVYHWKDWGKWFRWGTRHTSAASLAYLGKGKFKIFTVSSDYAVHYFDGFKIYCLTEKHGYGN